MATIGVTKVLVVDDDERFRRAVVDRLRRNEIQVEEAGDGVQAWDLLQRREFDVAVLDMVMPGMCGLELLEQIKGKEIECEVILLTGQASVESAVAAMKLGAYDYLMKPFSLPELEKTVARACRKHALAKENRQLKALLERNLPKRPIIGASPAVREILRLIERAAPSDKPILIQGESGTGKELVAWALHENNARCNRPMVVINCAALPESLLESELFGHEKGAFTGAERVKRGLFEVADGGTLFIDEIGEMPAAVQVKLLRVLEDGSLRRVGSNCERFVDVRLLAATNRNLEEQIEKGRFREDLYYRINVMSLELPPLRERKGDVALLVKHFLGAGWRVEEPVLELLTGYHWPGNVRQLINVIDRAKILSEDGVIRSRDLPRGILEGSTSRGVHSDQESNTDELAILERGKIVEVLKREGGNKTRAARALGIERRKLYRLLEKYGIRGDEEVTSAVGLFSG